MKDLIKQYLDNGIFASQAHDRPVRAGHEPVAVKTMAQSLSAAAPASAMREVQGTGGALFVQQLKAAGVEFIFFNPSTGDFPIFDALVDEPRSS